MGCFLACFGISKTRKRRRLSNRVAAAGGDYRRGSYVALDSSTLAIIGLNGSKKRLSIAGCEQLRDKPKEATKIRKKVSFNLNVQTYEPILKDYDFVESEEEEEEVDNVEQEVSKRRSSTSASTRASTALTSSIGLFPSNYRYQNVRDSYDSYEEEEYVADEDSDYEDYYGDDDYCDGDSSDIDDPRMSQEGLPKQSFSSSLNKELESYGWNQNAGDNIPYAHSVLSPIENLSQWKAAKAKVAEPKQQKENVPSFQEPRFVYSRSNCNHSKPLLQEIPVHASLSSWIKQK